MTETWYEVVQPNTGLMQGDLILDCPISWMATIPYRIDGGRQRRRDSQGCSRGNKS